MVQYIYGAAANTTRKATTSQQLANLLSDSVANHFPSTTTTLPPTLNLNPPTQARKLAGLLQESERSKEALQGEFGEQVLEVQRVKQDIQQLLEHNGRLQAVSDEHQSLKSSYNQLLNR